MRLPVRLAVFAALLCLTQARAASRGVVVDGAGPWRDARWALAVTEFTRLLTEAGYQVETVAPADLPAALPSDILLAVPSLERLPLASFQAVASFVSSGGSLMASGGEPFRTPLYRSPDGAWLDRKSLLAPIVPEKTIFDPATSTLQELFLTTAPVTRSTVTGPDGQSNALDFRIEIPETGQFYLLTAPLTRPIFGVGQHATVVWTRGTPGQSMLLEWDETDGSRWIATIPLAGQWTKHVLLPDDFHYFTGGTPDRARGIFNPSEATKFYFGVSTAQGAQPGPLEFAVSAIGAGTAPALEPFQAPPLETVSPSFKQYTIERAGETVRVPVTRGRGLSATPDPDGRYRAIGNPLSPVATWYVSNAGILTVWLPWPVLPEPERTQLVALLRGSANRLYLLNAGPAQFVVLPREDVVLGARVRNASQSAAQANLLWSILNSSGAVATQFTVTLNLAAGQLLTVTPTGAGRLPPGDYTVTASLVAGAAEADRIDSRVRVFDPVLTFGTNRRVKISNGTFSTADGRRLFLQGVNYWPRYTAGLDAGRFTQSWLSPQNYDPDLIEADLALIASLNFNLVSIAYTSPAQARSLVDFLDRCRRHGLWANIFIPAFIEGPPPGIAYAGQIQVLNPDIGSMLHAAFLPENDQALAFDILWEPHLGAHDTRLILDEGWRAWIVEQYGSLANAERTWGITAPRDAQGQLSNPLDSQIEADGEWRVMVAAYRRFADDYLGHAIGGVARAIRRIAPGTLLSFRSTVSGWSPFNNFLMGYDLGAAAAHVDFVSSEAWGLPVNWPDARSFGFPAAYGKYRASGKPVYWAEYGLNLGANPTSAARARQATNADTMMRLVSEDGSSGASVWWLPGGLRPDEGTDFGIVEPDGSPRESALVLKEWGAKFASAPPSQSADAPVTLTVDRDTDARGQYGLFLRWQKDYADAKLSGRPVVVKDPGTGTDTSTMPLVQVGNTPYGAFSAGPLKYANADFAEIRVACPGIDVVAENGAQIAVPETGTCQVTPSIFNTGSATWLPASVFLQTNLGDLPLRNPLPYLQRTDIGTLNVTIGQSNLEIVGQLHIRGVGPFSGTLRVTLVKQANVLPPSLTISTASLPGALVGTPYSQPLAASGGTAPYSWSITSGALPSGLELRNNPTRIEGMPTSGGSFGFTLQVIDSVAQRAASSFTISVGGGAAVSGASFLPVLARGAIATINGSQLSGSTATAAAGQLPTQLSGTRVLVNGVAAPLFFVSPGQINFQVPFETPIRTNVPIVTERSGLRVLATTATVAENAPAIFTYQRTPVENDPIIVHDDGSLVAPGHPARPSEILTAYGTGIGALDNAPATGAPAPVSPVAASRIAPSITIGTVSAQPIFTGLAPGLVGVAQFQFQLPPTLPPGPFAPLTIRLGNASTQIVNLAVP